MIIRKLFKFENTHIVRGCSTKRCSQNIHGHSYEIEVLLESDFLDNGHMVYDFGLIGLDIKDIIDSFDHGVAIWSLDDKEYIKQMKKFSKRWVVLPVSPSAEQLSRVLFLLVDTILQITKMQNGEKNVTLQSIIVHETKTGYAQAFRGDVFNEKMGNIPLEQIEFSNAVKQGWRDGKMFEKMLNKETITNPKEI